MKNNLIIASLFISAALIFSNCEKIEDVVDFPVKDPTLVLNCYFSSDSLAWVFQVSKSLSVIDNAELKLITDAKIKLFKNDTLVAENIGSDPDELYRLYGHPAKQGNTYRVEVTHPKYKTITASDMAVRKTSFNVVKHIITDSSTYYDPFSHKSWGWISGSMTVKISDHLNEENFYRINMYYYDSSLFIKAKNTVYLTSENPAVEGNYYQGLLLSDYLFNGQSYEINYDFEDYSYYSGKEYFITIESLSKAFYFYERSYSLYLDRQGDPFSEPVQVYNNIENGYGIFANLVGKEKKYVF